MELTLPKGDFDAYIFDCDGTLADTMPLHYEAWCAVLKGTACEFPEALFYELGGVTTEGVVKILNERHGSDMDPKETSKRKEEIYLNLISRILPIEPVVAFMHQFHGKVPMAVASGGKRQIVTHTLEALGIAGKFDAIVCAEDYTRGKPAPDPFLVAAEKLNVSPEKCLVFEDTQTGIEAAKAAGMQWVLVPAVERGVVS